MTDSRKNEFCFRVTSPIEKFWKGGARLTLPSDVIEPEVGTTVVLFDPEYEFSQFPVKEKGRGWIRIGEAIPWGNQRFEVIGPRVNPVSAVCYKIWDNEKKDYVKAPDKSWDWEFLSRKEADEQIRNMLENQRPIHTP